MIMSLYPKGDKMPTIKDVAKEAGVSIATVSYVMNDRVDMVSDKTRQHVLETARRMGYHANTIARNLQSSRTGLLGYAWHSNPVNQPNMLMDQFIYHLAQAAEQHKYHLLTFTHPSDDPIAVYEELIHSKRVDGFVVAGTQENDPRILYLLEKQFPFASFGRTTPELDIKFNWVDTDGRTGMFDATKYLIEKGHRRIAFLGWPSHSLSGNDRLAGYMDAITQYNIPQHESYILQHDYAESTVETAFEQWQTLPTDIRPTALLAVSDYVAFGAMRAAEKFGYTVGQDMHIIGFDDAPFVNYTKPGMTTLAQPLEDVSNTLIKTVDRIIRGEQFVPYGQLFAPSVIKRGSTGD